MLRVPVAIQIGGHRPLEDSASLTSTDNLLEVIGGAGEEGLLLFLNADSTDVAVADGEAWSATCGATTTRPRTRP